MRHTPHLHRSTIAPSIILAALSAWVGLPVLSPPARAQGPVAVSAFVARNGALPSNPTLGGLAFSTYTGPLGFRLSGAMHLTQTGRVTEFDSPRLGVGAWSADADLVLAPLRSAGILKLATLGFSPYAFVGLGGHGLRLRELPDTNIATWSYGAGAHHSLIGGLGIEGEARYRQPLHKDRALPAGFAPAWEYRAGLSISFGGGSRHRRDTRFSTTAMTYRVERENATTEAERESAEDGAGAIRRDDLRDDRRDDARRETRDEERAGDADADDAGAANGSGTLISTRRVIDTADDFLGTRYLYGGTSPGTGFDCSGFVQYVFARQSVRLPRTSRQQARVGEKVPASVRSLRRGDLVLFAHDGVRVDHVAIYAGGNRIIHSSSSGRGVRYDDLSTERGKWFVSHMVAARRVANTRKDVADLLRVFDEAARGNAFSGDDELDPPDRAPAPRPRQ